MTNCVTLTHEDAFANIKLMEKLDSLQKKEIYGVGVDGKRFKLMKMKDNFFSRIWFSILKFLKFIKADDKSIKQLRQYTIDHLQCSDYKEWATTHSKVSKVGIKSLIEENDELKTQIKEGRSQHSESDMAQGNLQSELKSQKSAVKDLQLRLAQAQSELATANADKEQLSLTVDNQDKFNLNFEKEIKEQKALVSKYRKRSKHYKEDRAYLQEGWKSVQPETSITDFLKENKLYDAIHGKFHKHSKEEK
jgi:chromosome segregation ATPase